MTDDIDALLGADPATMTYEQARDGLTQVVHRLESGGAPLEQSLALWEQGERFAARCGEWLDNAEQRLAAAADDAADQQVAPAPADVPAAEEPPW